MSADLQSQVLVLNSKQKTSGNNQNANYNLLSMGGIGGSPSSSYELLSYHSVNQVYNVESGVNDKIYFDEGSGLLTATLPLGSYNVITLLAEIIAKMNAESGSNYTSSVLAVDGRKFGMIVSAGTFQFLFFSNQVASARRLLGMDAVDDILAASHVSDNPIDLRNHTNILLTIPQEGNKHVTLLDGSEYSFILPLDVPFGTEIHHRKQVHYQQLIQFTTNLSIIDVEQYTEDGVPLVNAPDYVLVLRRIL